MIDDYTNLDLNKSYYYINDISTPPEKTWNLLMSRIVRVCCFKARFEPLGDLIGFFNTISEDGCFERPINLNKSSNNNLIWFERLPEMMKYLKEKFPNHEKYMTVVDTMNGRAITLYRKGDLWR